MLYTLILYSDVRQLFLKKTGEKKTLSKKQMNIYPIVTRNQMIFLKEASLHFHFIFHDPPQKKKKLLKKNKTSHFCRWSPNMCFPQVPFVNWSSQVGEGESSNPVITNQPAMCNDFTTIWEVLERVFREKLRGHWHFGPAQNNLTEERVDGQVKRKCSCSSGHTFIPSLLPSPPSPLPLCLGISQTTPSALGPGRPAQCWPGSSLQLRPQSMEVCDIWDSAHLGNSAQASDHISPSI